MTYKNKTSKEYMKEYYQRPEVKAKQREYQQRPEFKEYQKEYQKEYYQENKDKIEKYYQKNREKIIIRSFEWSKKNREKVKKSQKKYSQKPEAKKKINKRKRERTKTNKNFNIITRLRALLSYGLRYYTKTGKIMSASKYGINYQAIIEHLKPFPEDLAKYHIDHIKPLCSFNLENPEEIKIAFAPENHQWLTIQKNLSKGGRY